jgi:hypothetical protein
MNVWYMQGRDGRHHQKREEVKTRVQRMTGGTKELL